MFRSVARCAVVVLTFTSFSACGGAKPASSSAPPATPAAQPAAAATSANDFTGTVAETMNSGGYTYARLQAPGKDDVWIAGNEFPAKAGERLTVALEMPMQNFESKTLKRTFDKVVFGKLAGAAVPAGMPMPQAGMNGASPHAGAAATPDVAVVKGPKASGADGRTVAELYAQRAKLKDKPVAVRGTVVKFLPSIMGKNWIHLRDGSGAAADGSNDLVVTTMETAKVGDVVTARGTVRTDIDLGMGYSYKVIVENAKLQK
jgi:hypothetical protein